MVVGIFFSFTTKAQSVTGVVYTQDNSPVSGVIVKVKGTDVSTTTNGEGQFTLACTEADILTFTHMAYLYKEEKVGARKAYTFHLLDRFVDNNKDITGPFGETVAREDNLGSVATVYNKDLEKYISTDILPALQGRIAGLNVSQYRGSALTSVSSNTRVDLIGSLPSTYGTGSLSDNTRFDITSRGVSPVVIVDGVERSFFSIDPEDIESVSLERDALSSMFLGMKSSRGALVITTKKPTAGKLSLSLTGKFGVHSNVKSLKPLSASQYAYLLNEALQNDGKAQIYTYNDYQAYLTGSDPYGHPNINWEDEVMNSHATTQSYNLNVSGGNRIAQYIVNLGYMNEEGLFKTNKNNDYNTNLNYNRYIISSKVNINVTQDLTASLSAIGRIIEGNQPGGSGSGYSDLLLTVFQTPNNAYPVYNENGSFGGNYSFQNNLVSQVMESGYISDNTRDIMATGKLRYDFNRVVKGLSAQFLGNVTTQTRTAITRTKRNPVYEFSINDSGNPVYSQYGSPSPQTNNFSSVSNYHNLYGQLSVDYKRQFGLHTVSGSIMGDTRHEIDDYDLPMIPSNIMESFGYDYAKKYFIQGRLTESYYNRYAPGNRWGTFGAIGLGWDISKESFMEPATWVHKLKIRGTWGRTGNGVSNSGYYIWRQTYSTNLTALYPLGSERSNGYWVTEDGLANPYISYEQANKLNIGLDMAFLKNRLSGTIEYYNDKYFDLLQQRGKSIAILGATYPYENIGRTRRYGWDVTLTWQDNIGALNYYISGNWSIAHTKLLFMDEQETPYNYLRQTGRPEGVIFGLQADGFLTAEDIANNYPVMVGYDVQPGDVKYVDQNGDKVINEWDRVVIGGDKPVQYFGLDLGLEWKGFEFSMLWQGVYNRDLYVNNRTLVEGFQPIGNSYGQAYTNMLARWTPETASTAKYPRLTAGGNTYNYGGYYGSSLWMQNGNYIRLKNASIAYNLPEAFCNNILGGIRVKVFLEGQNLLTFSGCDLVDPEVTFTSSPLQRTIFTGVKLNF
ncbi:MAG: SusC/RagA family TonB-linked outer membrane protein [Prevotella sp.]|nr:SusC/RagA family TonB-linked outer membrane protein [Prevotella sp.]